MGHVERLKWMEKWWKIENFIAEFWRELLGSALIVAIFTSLVWFIESTPISHTRNGMCDDICIALKYINSGENIPGGVHVPTYMNRFDLERVKVGEKCQLYLPKNIFLGEYAVLFTDKETGHQWLTNGVGTWYRVNILASYC